MKFNYLFSAMLILLVCMPNNANAEELHQYKELLDVTLTESTIDFSGGLLDGQPFLYDPDGGTRQYFYSITDNDLTTYASFYSGGVTYEFEYPANINGYRIYTNCKSCTQVRFYLVGGTTVMHSPPTNTTGDFIELNLTNVKKIEIRRKEGTTFRVYEFNAYGTLSMPIPPKVQGVTVSNVTHNEAEVAWDSVEDAILYKIYLDNKLVGEAMNTTYKLTNLKSDTEYEIRVSAVNEGGEGPSSDPVTFTTLPLPVPSKVQGVTVKNITATSALISWDANPENEGVLKYIVYLNNKKYEETTNTEYTLNNLQPTTTYTVQIEAVNMYGAGPQSDLVEFTTLEIPPDPATQVRNIVIKNMTSTSATISWPPNPTSEKIIKYVIYVNDEKHGETEGTEYVLEDLKEGERYTVIVTAVNALGEGPPSAPITFVPLKIADISSTIKVQDVLSSIAVLFTNLWPLLAFALALIAVVPITTALKQTITRRRSNA